MLTPIKTLIKNLSNNPVRIRVTNRITLCMGAAGTDMHSAELNGELFSMLDNDRSSMAVLDMIRTGLIELTYIADPKFVVKSADTNFMNIPYGITRDWYLNASAKPAATEDVPAPTKQSEKPKQAEVPKQETAKAPVAEAAPAKPEAAAKPVEPAVEQLKQVTAPKKEETKQEEPKPEEPKKEAPKAGRKIKVQ